jgi:bacillithiol synthase
MNVECSKLPVTPYLDIYQNEFDRVSDLYSYNHRNPEDWKTRANELTTRFSDSDYRNQLADALLRYNKRLGAGEKALQSIEQIRTGALTIVTGQQAGILGGPLYTVYKAITAILLADHYKTVLQIPVVPVFWIAAEDHDFLEVNHTYIPTSDWNVRKLQLQGEDGHKRSIGYISVTRDQLERMLSEIENATHATEFRDACLQMVRDAWEMTDNMGDWFGAIIATLFHNTNLLFVNPIVREFRELTNQVFVHAIELNDRLREAAHQGAENIKACGFEPQVRIMPNSSLLFLQTDEGRSPLDVENGAFHVRGTDTYYSTQDLMEIARSNPQSMSSNVLLRPVVQDHLLPTLAYVGGGAEVAYHGMLKPIFALYGIQMPIIVPRISATIVEKAISKSIKKYELDLDAFLSDPHAKESFLRKLDDIGVDDTFEVFIKKIDNLYDELTATLVKIDPQLKDLANENNQWVKDRIHSLQHKTMQFHEQKHEIAVRQIQKVLVSLKPEGQLQERVYTLLPYLIKYGFSFMDQLLHAFPSGEHANYYLFL